MLHSVIVVSNKLGLHARASAKLTQLAGKYHSDITLARHGRQVNAKSIMGVMMLAAGFGTEVSLEVKGSDEQEAHDAIVALFNNKFDENE